MQKKPPGIRHRGYKPHPLPCGSRFYPRKPHRGPPDTPRQTLRGQSPLPQRSIAAPCGSGFYPRKPHRGPPDTPRQTLRGQSPLPQGSMAAPCGSGFYPRKPRCGPPDTPRQTLRGQSPLPQGSVAASVGAGSTRESHTAVRQIHRAKPFAGRAHSHKDRWQPLWERVLPANATPRSCRYNAPNSSRAEPAPTGISATQGGNCSPEGAAARVISGTALPRWSR